MIVHNLKDRNFNATFTSIVKEKYPILIFLARFFDRSLVSEGVDTFDPFVVGCLGVTDASETVI